MARYLEASSPNVRAPLDLCICISAIPSTIQTMEDARTGSLTGEFIPSSRADARSLFVAFLKLPSLCARKHGTGDNSYAKPSVILTSLAFATIINFPNRSLSDFTVIKSSSAALKRIFFTVVSKVSTLSLLIKIPKADDVRVDSLFSEKYSYALDPC